MQKKRMIKKKITFQLRNDPMPLDLGARAFQIVSANALCKRGMNGKHRDGFPS